MIPITKPHLKIMQDKLYVSRRSGIISLMLFLLTITVFTAFFHYLSNGVVILIIFILGEIIFGLDAFGEWEELLLDKSQNLVTVKKYSWCDKLFSTTPEKYTFTIKLSDIRHVGVSQNMGLFMLPRNGKAITFSTQGLKREEVQNMKRDINIFLNAKDCNSVDLGVHCLSTSESDEYLRSLLGKCNRRSILQEVPFSTFIANGQMRDVSVQQHKSTPSFGSQKGEEISEFPHRILKKRSFGTNIFLQNIHSLQSKHRNWVHKR